MEFASIEREVYVAASPEVVFDVVSRPEHVREWWPDEAAYDVAPGATGEIRFGDPTAGGTVETFTVVDVRPPESFTFRWTGHDLLVAFSLTPQGEGTLLRMIETGFREAGWGQAVLEETYRDHERGWDFFLPRIAPYVARLDTSLDASEGTVVTTAVDDELWSAIGDPMRRQLVDLLLAEGEGTATTLGARLPISRQAVTKHLGVLDRVGLVRGTPEGRERRYRLDDEQLQRAVTQLNAVGATWDARLQRIKRIAETIQSQQEEERGDGG